MSDVSRNSQTTFRLASISHTVRTPSFSHPRRAREVVFSLGGWSEGTALNSISVYNQKEKAFFIGPTLKVIKNERFREWAKRVGWIQYKIYVHTYMYFIMRVKVFVF